MILLVDDEAGVRKLLATVLRRQGYTVLEAATGLQALELFEPAADDILLLVADVVMPDLRGPEIAARLRERRPDLRVLFITGYEHPKGLEPGDAILQKPFVPGTFVARVEELLR